MGRTVSRAEKLPTLPATRRTSALCTLALTQGLARAPPFDNKTCAVATDSVYNSTQCLPGADRVHMGHKVSIDCKPQFLSLMGKRMGYERKQGSIRL